MQRALAELELLGFEGNDPQIGGRVRYFAERAPFMCQFRSQFLCPDDEFELFAQGIEPAAWRRWRDLQQSVGSRYSPANFPPMPEVPGWQVLREMEGMQLDRLLHRLIAHNDRRIQDLALGEFLKQACLRGWSTRRRGNGEWLAINDLCTAATSLRQKHEVLQQLVARGWPAVIFAQPQQLSIVIDANGSDDAHACHVRAGEMHSELRKATETLPGCKLIRGSWCNRVSRTEIECENPDAALAQVMPILQRYRELSLQIVRRYGWHGAREVESTLPI